MNVIPLASDFLAGSLLSLLLPVALLISLVVWYVRAVRRVPSSSGDVAEVPLAPSEPGAGVADKLP